MNNVHNTNEPILADMDKINLHTTTIKRNKVRTECIILKMCVPGTKMGLQFFEEKYNCMTITFISSIASGN